MRSRSALDLFGSGPQRELIDTQVLRCQLCDAVFSHPNLLQRHMTRQHPQPRQVKRRLDMLRDSQDGKAVCAYCHKSFTNWSTLTFHIQNQFCNPPAHDITHPPRIDSDSDGQDQSALHPLQMPQNLVIGLMLLPKLETMKWPKRTGSCAITSQGIVCYATSSWDPVEHTPHICGIITKQPYRMPSGWDCRDANSTML